MKNYCLAPQPWHWVEVNAHLVKKCMTLWPGTLVDATIIVEQEQSRQARSGNDAVGRQAMLASLRGSPQKDKTGTLR